MKAFDIYMCIMGSIILKLLIQPTIPYLFSCVLLGMALGAYRGSQN